MRLPFYYGWVIAGVVFVSMAVGVNARTAFSLLFPPILDEFGWPRGVTAGAFSFGGPSEETARAVPAAAALIAIAATAWLGARLLGGRAGLAAGLALSTSLGFFVYGRYVRPETLLLATLAGTAAYDRPAICCPLPVQPGKIGGHAR